MQVVEDTENINSSLACGTRNGLRWRTVSACPAPVPHASNSQELLHPRGQCVSAHVTCPGCGRVLIAHRLTHTQGMKRCPDCDQVVLIGLTVFLLPPGPHSTPNDYSLPSQDAPLVHARRRTRKRRIAALGRLGLGDPMPQIALERYTAGMPINRVVVVPEPKSEPGSST